MSTPGVMTKFRITELSGVDNPAQKGARAVIMKRDVSDKERKRLAETGAALPDGSFPIETKADLENAVKAYGRASDPARAKTHIIARAKALGATDLLPADWEGSTAASGQKNEDTDMNEIKKALGLADTATDAEVAAAIAKAATDLASAQASLATMTKVAALAPAVREHYEALVKADKKKDAEDLLDMGADEAAEKVKKAAAGDETVEIDGRTISKRAVGDDVFAVMKSQAERIARSEADIKKAREETATANFTKRAETEFAHVGGTVEERVALLKALDGADPIAKAAAEKVLKAAESVAKLAFEKLGHSDAGEGDGEGKIAKATTDFEGRVEAIMKRDTTSRHDAMAKAAVEFPKEFAAYREATDGADA